MTIRAGMIGLGAIGGDFKIVRRQFHSSHEFLQGPLGDFPRGNLVMQHGLEREGAQCGRVIMPVERLVWRERNGFFQ